MAEKYQEEDSDRGQEHHSEYLRVIDDLSSELNTLSRQVNMVQRDFLTDEVAKQFESSLKGLETQNDLLQSAVESLIQERETIERTLQAQNEELKSQLCARDEELHDLQTQLHQLQQRPCQSCGNIAAGESSQVHSGRRDEKRTDSVEELQKLEYELRRRSRVVDSLRNENARLSEELMATRRSQGKMKLLQRRGVMSAVAGEKASNDGQLVSRLAAAEDENREREKSLQKALKDISYLQQEVSDLRTAEAAFNEERELLQNEIIALKETQAAQIGKQNSLKDQLQGTMVELYAAKEQLRETVQLRDHADSHYRKELQKFHERHVDLLEKYNALVDLYNNVFKEYKNVVQIEQEKSNQIQTFNAWKKEQLTKERKVRQKMQIYEDHIKKMIEDKQLLLDKLHETHADNLFLLKSVDRSSRRHANSIQSTSFSSPSGGYFDAANVSTHPVSKVIEDVRSTSRRVSQQRRVLEDEAGLYAHRK